MALRCDTCTHESVENFTSREGDSLDSTCRQTPTRPPHSSQEAVGISPFLQGYQYSVTTTQEAIDHSLSAQSDVSLSTCPLVTPERQQLPQRFSILPYLPKGPWNLFCPSNCL